LAVEAVAEPRQAETGPLEDRALFGFGIGLANRRIGGLRTVIRPVHQLTYRPVEHCPFCGGHKSRQQQIERLVQFNRRELSTWLSNHVFEHHQCGRLRLARPDFPHCI
jgi:hypothetical protein